MDNLTEMLQPTDIQRLYSQVNCPPASYQEIRQNERDTAFRRWKLLCEVSAEPIHQPDRSTL